MKKEGLEGREKETTEWSTLHLPGRGTGQKELPSNTRPTKENKIQLALHACLLLTYKILLKKRKSTDVTEWLLHNTDDNPPLPNDIFVSKSGFFIFNNEAS